jgi:hypothetical protein
MRVAEKLDWKGLKSSILLICMAKYVLTTTVLVHAHAYWRTGRNVCYDKKPLAQGIPRTVNKNLASRTQNFPLLRNFQSNFNHHTNFREAFSRIFVLFPHILRNLFRKVVHDCR